MIVPIRSYKELFNLSNVVIELKPSPSFTRFFFLIHCLTMAAILNCGFSPILKSSSLFLLGLFFIYHYKKKAYPAPGVKRLCFLCDYWLVETQNGAQIYENHKILLDTGLFFLLRFTGARKQTFLIFFDQLEEDAYRWLRILEKVQRR